MDEISLKRGENVSETTLIIETRHLIIASGMRYDDIAAGCGVSKSTISRIANGNGAHADSIERISAFLRPLVPDPTPDLPDTVPRETVLLILAEKDKQIAQLRIADASHMMTVKKVARQRLVWAVIEAILLLAVIGWFIWDLTHPEVGLIRLKQAGYIGRMLLGCK